MRPGYRQTEVGVIPEDWEVAPVSSLLEKNGRITYGVVQPGKNDPFGVLFIRGGDVFDGQINIDGLRRIPEDISTQYKRTVLCGGEILISLVGFPGESAIVPEELSGANIARQVALVRLSKEIGARSDFVCHYLRSTQGKRLLLKEAFGSAQQVINLKEVNKLELPLPPTKEEQSAIATALSDVDALLAGLDKLIAKKRDLKQAAMQQLLTGKTRLPGFSGEWETRLLGDAAHIKTGSRNNEDKVEDGGYPFFVRSDDVERINSYAYDCEAILVPGEGRIGEIFHYINGKFDVHQRVYAITKFMPEVSGRFVHLYMKAHFGAWAMQNTVKATVDSLRLPTFQNFEMKMPPGIEEQTAITEVLGDMDSELAVLEQRREKTRLLKQGMMQELLTGKTRLM